MTTAPTTNPDWTGGAAKFAAVLVLVLAAGLGIGAGGMLPGLAVGPDRNSVRTSAGTAPAHGSAPVASDAAGASPAEAPAARDEVERLIDLNSAEASELERLPRIGPKLAAEIVADRARRGPFRSVDDLDRVKGIGPRTVELIRPHARAGAGDNDR